jgi:hypothetical protein
MALLLQALLAPHLQLIEYVATVDIIRSIETSQYWYAQHIVVFNQPSTPCCCCIVVVLLEHNLSDSY